MTDGRANRGAVGISEIYAQERAASRKSASQYDAAYETPFYVGERRLFVEKVELVARMRSIDLVNARILDVGTGTGSIIGELKRRGARNIVGSDVSEDMITIAQTKFPDLKFIVSPIEEMPLPPASFDVVLGFSVLHHLPDLQLAFSRLASLLKPRGVFAFSEPNARSILEKKIARRTFRVLLYPIYKSMKLHNRKTLASRPKMIEDDLYSDVHRSLTRQELISSLPPELEAKVTSSGVIAPLFNDAAIDRPLDQIVLRVARTLDRALPLEGYELIITGNKRS